MKKRRKKLRLTTGEIEILEMLWQAKSATISQSHESLSRKVGYTTVQTRLNRMVEKGLVERIGSHPANYRALVQPDDVSREDLDVLVHRVTGGRVVPLVAHLVKDRDLSPDEIRELKELISAAEQKNQKRRSSEDKQ